MESMSSRSQDEKRSSSQEGESGQKGQQEKKLRQKLDMILIPVIMLMLVFQYLDKGAIGSAKIDGIEEDLGISQRQFNAATSIWSAGYMLFQIPSNLIITRVHPGRYLSFWVAAWSVVGLCHAFVQGFGGLMAVRFFLGVCDAPFLVGSMHLLSSWYTTRELALRMSVILGCLILTLTLVGPISAGIYSGLGTKLGWRGWRWLYLVFGLCGVVIALVGFVLLPGYPNGAEDCWWLTHEQKTFAAARIEEDRVGEKKVVRNKLRSGFKDAWNDKKTWLFVLSFTCRRSFEGIYIYFPSLVQSSMPQIVHTHSLSLQNMTLLLTSPPALLAALLAIGIGYSSDKHSERCWHITTPLGFALIGLVISAATLDGIARYAAAFLYIPGSVAGGAMSWSWLTSSLNETAEKKACGIAIVGVMSGFGGILGPFLFKGHDKPRYLLAFVVLTILGVLEVLSCFGVRKLLRQANSRLRRMPCEHEGGTEAVKLYVL